MDTTTGWSTASKKTFHAAKNKKQIKTKKESKRNPRMKKNYINRKRKWIQMQRQPEKPTRTQKRRVEAWKPQACEAATSQVSKLEGGWGRVCIASPPHPLGPLQALYS